MYLLFKPSTFTDSLGVTSQLVFQQQVLYRYACITITFVHQNGGYVGFYVDCVILITS